MDLDPPGPKDDLDAPGFVGPEDEGADGPKSGEGLGGRVAVRVVGTDRDDRHGRSDHLEQGRGRRCPAAVVGDLEDVDPREAAGEEEGIDALLGVAGQQEAVPGGGPEEDDRGVVDRAARVWGRGRDAPGEWPEGDELDHVEGEAVAGGQGSGPPVAAEELGEGRGRRAGSAHPVRQDEPDPVAGEERR